MISISFPWPRSILWQVWALAFPRPDEAETETCCKIRDKFDVITDDGHERMWPKQLLGPCGAPPKHVTSSSIIQQSGMFSLLAETLTPLQSGMHGKAKHPQSRVFSLGSPLVKDDPTSYATTHPSLKYHQNWFQVSVIKLAWFNSYQTNTHCFVIIFPPSATHVPSFAVGKPKIGKKRSTDCRHLGLRWQHHLLRADTTQRLPLPRST